MAELPDLAYNQSVPANWWDLVPSFTPTRWCYGMGTYGGSWGADTDSTACMANNVYMTILYLRAAGWSFQSIIAVCANYQNESGLDPRNWEVYADINRGFGLPQWTPQRQYQMWAENIWDQNTDPFAPYFYNGWYELYIQASEVFGYPHTQWEKHTTNPNGNPATGSPSYPGYPGLVPDHWYQDSFAEFAAGQIGDASISSDPYDRLDYLTGEYFWNYEQVADYVADYTLAQRRTRARNWYDRMSYRFTDFAGGTVIQPTVPGPDFTAADLRVRMPAWMYKVLYMSSHKQGGLSQYAR